MGLLLPSLVDADMEMLTFLTKQLDVNATIAPCFLPHLLVCQQTIFVLWHQASSLNEQSAVVTVSRFTDGIARKDILHIVVSLTVCAANPYAFCLV